jgi:16S rRNA (guanine(966)-N(2))-methyltransferase RsmD
LPVADRPGLRPTPDRVRETLFNWLGQDLSGWQVLDAFAGTGALGLEAASRGATRVLLAEQDGASAQGLQALVERLQGAAAVVQVVRGSGIALLQRQAPASLDLVLLDPPFDAGLYTQALAAALPALKPGAWLYLEAPVAWRQASDCDKAGDSGDQGRGEAQDQAPRVPPGLALCRHLQAGAVHAHLFERTASVEGGPTQAS